MLIRRIEMKGISEMKKKNEIKIELCALSVNESVARTVVGAFCSQLNPTATELADIKCALSEAVTNCIVHAYKEAVGSIYITVVLYDNDLVKVVVKDKGLGIENVKCAMQPLYTTDKSGERSGMGFCVMESFMDKIKVRSKPGRGTVVTMYKRIAGGTLI